MHTVVASTAMLQRWLQESVVVTLGGRGPTDRTAKWDGVG